MAKRKVKETTNQFEQKNMYISPSFDTHKAVKSFTLAGIKEPQAEAIVEAIVNSRDHDLSKLATKEQLGEVKMEIQSVKGQVEAVKVQLEAKIDSSISKLEASLLKWFIATAITLTGILSGIILAAAKFIH